MHKTRARASRLLYEDRQQRESEGSPAGARTTTSDSRNKQIYLEPDQNDSGSDRGKMKCIDGEIIYEPGTTTTTVAAATATHNKSAVTSREKNSTSRPETNKAELNITVGI